VTKVEPLLSPRERPEDTETRPDGPATEEPLKTPISPEPPDVEGPEDMNTPPLRP